MRRKRQIDEDREDEPTDLTKCQLKLVADYTFFSDIGSKNAAYTARYLISVVEEVNKIFEKVDFGLNTRREKMIGMGLMIKKLIVHRAPSSEPGYNDEIKKNVDSQLLLEDFANHQADGQHCLVHLVTGKQLADGVLGIAYPGMQFASEELEDQHPGICGGSSYCERNQYIRCLNAALTSAVGYTDEQLSTRETILVMAHEIGHNFGARHDVDYECIPSSGDGGTFLMHPSASRGYDPNNNQFSECSIRTMHPVMARHSVKCFVAPIDSYCGNGVVEEGEDCDAGILLDDYEQDPCCTTTCAFRIQPEKGKVTCSPKNSQCCLETCTVAPPTQICHYGVAERCTARTFCTGNSSGCPAWNVLPDGTDCFDKGVCKDGQCLDWCEQSGLKPCLCENEAQACFRCCRKSKDDVCKPHPLGRELMLNGSRCFYGKCNGWKCETGSPDQMKTFTQIITDPHELWNFVKPIWVLVVAVIWLIIWVPMCKIIYGNDEARRAENREKLYEWQELQRQKTREKMQLQMPDRGQKKKKN
ncbi:hypothetical protein L596_014859 [Steinernema carpocapsae]|uniref:Peptidase M12B domain-containing protein n=1 Tax=Steinernema carpocapsae TaxID=34508 RepID=A0A4U5NE09_STECR|nr:hypothetical protein L596_014859 [Steinernema carpocapsae]